MKFPTIAIIPLSILIALAGCGQSKEDAALARIRNRPKPGFLRVLNLLDSPVTVKWTNMTLDPNTLPFTASPFRPLGAKKQKIDLLANEQALASPEVEVPTDDRVTAIVYRDGSGVQHHDVVGDITTFAPGANVQVHFVGLGGASIEGGVTLKGAGGSFDIDSKTGSLTVPAGEYEVSGAGLSKAIGGSIEADAMYSVYVIKLPDGKTLAMLVRNTTTDRPMATGTTS